MQNNDAPGDKEMQDLQQLWQESTTSESFTIKERAMIAGIHTEINHFNRYFATGQWWQIFFNCLLLGNATLNLVDGIRHNDVNKIAFHLAFALTMLSFLIFHAQVRFKIHSFNHSSNREYIQMQLMRVKQEIRFREKIIPLLSPVIFGLLIFGLWNDLPLWSIILLVMLFILLQMANRGKKLINKELSPLRDKLQSALQQLNEH